MMQWMFNLKKLFTTKPVLTDNIAPEEAPILKRKPAPGAIKEALNHPNGWVYEIDTASEHDANVSPQAIKGAWKVDSKGIIEGDFIPNPNYLATK
jgi:hypothetical protein